MKGKRVMFYVSKIIDVVGVALFFATVYVIFVLLEPR